MECSNRAGETNCSNLAGEMNLSEYDRGNGMFRFLVSRSGKSNGTLNLTVKA